MGCGIFLLVIRNNFGKLCDQEGGFTIEHLFCSEINHRTNQTKSNANELNPIRFCSESISWEVNHAGVIIINPYWGWPIRLQGNNHTFQESWLRANQQLIKKQYIIRSTKFNIDSTCFSGKQNVLPNNAFLFKTLHTTPRGHISLTQAVILSPTCNFFATIATLWSNMWIQVKNITIVYVFWLCHSL